MPSTEPNAKHAPHDPVAYRRSFLDRSLPFLSEGGEARLRDVTVAVAGCGGVGGALAITLARMGFRRFRLADPGRFDLPDLNRQWGATTRSLGRNKAEVYEETLKSIDPHMDVRIWTEGIQPHTLEPFIEGADVVVDCLDLAVPLALRAEMFEKAHAAGSFALTAPILGFGAMIVISDPQGPSMQLFVDLLARVQQTGALPEFLHRGLQREHIELIQEWLTTKRVKVPSMAIAPLAAAGVVATEILKAVLGARIPGAARPVVLPEIVLFDLYSARFTVADLSVLAEMPAAV